MPKWIWGATALSALTLAATGTSFDSARLVSDINTVPIPVSSGVAPVCASANFADFGASRDGVTLSLWRSDGSAADLQPLGDIGPARDSAALQCLTVSNGLAFFQYSANGVPAELWRTDGTPSGTLRLLRQPSVSAGPVRFAGALASPLFIASVGQSGNELVTSDGTVAGTRVLQDIAPGAAGPNFGSEFVKLAGRIFFSIDTALWATDGTANSATEIASLAPASMGFAYVGALRVIDSNLIAFVQSDTETSLWRSDGTSAGTTLFRSLSRQTDGYVNGQAARAGPTATLFTLQPPLSNASQLWRTDGTDTGTRRLVGPDGDLEVPQGLTDTGERQFFVGHSAQFGNELWISDGTEAGTRLLQDTSAGAADSLITSLSPAAGGIFYSLLNSDLRSRAPWFSDGTTAGTLHLGSLDSRLAPYDFNGYPLGFLGTVNYFWTEPFGTGAIGETKDITLWRYSPVTRTVATVTQLSGQGVATFAQSSNSRLFFAVADARIGLEPWMTDGSAVGTRSLGNLAPELQDGSSQLQGAFVYHDALLFGATDGNRGPGLWRSDGTAAGTRYLGAGTPSVPGSMMTMPRVQLGNLLIYPGGPTPDDNELWVTDGLTGGSQPITDLSTASIFDSTRIANAAPAGCGAGFSTVNGAAYFGASRFGQNAYFVGRLYRTDGTQNGTIELAAFPPTNPGRLFSVASQVCVLGSLDDHVYFGAFDTAKEWQGLWRYDATTNASEVVKTTAGQVLQAPQSLTQLGNALYFFSSDGAKRGWLRLSSGSATAEFVTTLDPSSTLDPPQVFRVVGSYLYFTQCGDPVGTCRLGRTDGTGAGTILLAEMDAATRDQLGVIGTRVLFTGRDSAHGAEPWITDGTTAATSLLKDITAGTGGSMPYRYADFQGLGYFLIRIDSGGGTQFEVWRTDGTAANTEPANVLPAVAAGTPAAQPATAFIALGQRLLFSAYTSATSEELWSFENLAPIAVADSAGTTTNNAVSIDVLSNDSDPDGRLDPATLRILETTSGTAQVDASAGTVRFSPTAAFKGTATFTYAISDVQHRESGPATVTISVDAPPIAPSGGGGGGGGGGGSMGTADIVALLIGFLALAARPALQQANVESVKYRIRRTCAGGSPARATRPCDKTQRNADRP